MRDPLLDQIAAGRFLPDLVREKDGWHARWRPMEPCVESAAVRLDEYVRRAAMTPLSADAEDQTHATLHDAWILALKSRTGLVRGFDDACPAFAAELVRWRGDASADAAARKGIAFVFDPAACSISCEIPHGSTALRALGTVPEFFGPLRGLAKQKGTMSNTLSVTLDRHEVEHFLTRGARALTTAGYTVRGCDIRATVALSAEVGASVGSRRDESAALKLVVKVAGQPVTAAEIRFLLEQNSTLVFFREHWIEVDRNILKEALRALEKSGAGSLTRAQAMGFASGIGRIGRFELEEVAAHGWIRGLLNDLKQAAVMEAGPPNRRTPAYRARLQGTLRAYQERGVAWLTFLTSHGFGALLADDMGLGKTIQTIAWILSEKNPKVLVVAPLTLLSNWRHELSSFAPTLKVYVHQGHDRETRIGFRRRSGESDVVLTSYNLLVRDHGLFADVAWTALVLDEAQAIKNPDTAVARAVRALTPPHRIALTGTPIENSVSDIWSIEEFLNPGFLGERKSFADRFVKALAADPHATAGGRLRRALEPFVLRRLKSDEGIATELGPKREIREYCVLAPRDRADYEAALADYRATERRRGDIFALLTRLKLVCDGAGKFERLVELLGRIRANGESVLVFTQYAKIGRELKAKLESQFGCRIFYLHGALTAKRREAEMQAFLNTEGPACFILSLKTGGFGLNLTKATHVIHYDRWWNPAVENQATDRAHRIGQSQTVFVHKMITEGTIEEHVDEILSRKTAVSDGLVASGEAFLAQLPPEVFERTVSLDE